MRAAGKLRDAFSKVWDKNPVRRRRDQRLFHRAAQKNQLDILMPLVEKYDDAVHWRDDKNFVLLHYAAEFSRPDLVSFLIDHHSQINSRDACMLTPLHLAASRASAETVEALVTAGANPLLLTDAGETAITLAEKHADTALADALRLGGEARWQRAEESKRCRLAQKKQEKVAAVVAALSCGIPGDFTVKKPLRLKR